MNLTGVNLVWILRTVNSHARDTIHFVDGFLRLLGDDFIGVQTTLRCGDDDLTKCVPARSIKALACDTLENCAGVAELADAPDSKSGGRKAVKVRFLSPAPTQ